MNDFEFLPDLIYSDLRVADQKEAINRLAELLEKSGLVGGDYKKDVLSREKVFPTGIAVKSGAVAIPHARSSKAFGNGVAVGVLDRPVIFHSMEDCDTEIDVEIVMLLAISESDKQLKMLQTIMKMLSKEEFILLLKEKESEEEIAQLLNSFL